MSTRSRIAIKTRTGYRSVYCHNDGYPEWNGRILLRHYSDEAKLKQIIKLGDMSSLGKEIGEKHDFNDISNAESVCRFYRRDRGERNVNARTARTLEELFQHADDCDAEFVYVFDRGQWLFDTVSLSKGQLGLKPLTVYDVFDIKGCPINPDAPLVAADWLEEHNRKEEADKIREMYGDVVARKEDFHATAN